MKKILIAAFGSVSMLGAGCTRVDQNLNSNSTVHPMQKETNDQKENLSSTTSIKYATSSTTSTKIFTLSNLNFTVPDKYSVLKVEKSTVWIKTDDNANNVRLMLSAEPLNENDYKAYKNDVQEFIDKKNSLTVEDKEIYHILDTRSVDAIDEYYLAKLNNKYFRFYPSIESDEKAPEGDELGFMPETKVTSMDIVNILKSAIR